MKIERITNSKYLPLLIISAAAITIYLNTLPNAFIYDDIPQIVNNSWITDFTHLGEILFSNVWAFDPTHTTSSYYRPVMLVVFTIEHSIFGFNPWGWHLVNIIIHALNGILVFLLLCTLIKEYSTKANLDGFGARTLSTVAALLFVAHPARTEVVAWVSAIPELTFTLFLLLSLYLYVLYKLSGKKSLLIISAFAFLLSTLSKETSLALPILIVAFDIFVDREKNWFRIPFRYLPYSIVVIIYLLLRTNALQLVKDGPGSHSYLSGFQFSLNVFPLFIEHMKMLVVPIKLSIFHVFHPVYSAGEFRFISSLVLTILIFALFYRLRRLDRLYLFAFALILIPLLPALYIPALDRNPFTERYLYLPGVGFALIAALFFRESFDYHCKKLGERAITYVTIPFLILFTLYGAGTIKRNFDWKSREALWSAAIKEDPKNYFALYELGSFHLSIEDPKGAIPYFKGSIESNNALRDQDPLILGRSYLDLANTYKRLKNNNKALTHYKIVLEMDSMRFGANLNVALIYHEAGELDSALTHYKRALLRATDKDDLVGILMNIGNIYITKGEYEAALNVYSQALETAPDDARVRRNIRLIEKRIEADRAR